MKTNNRTRILARGVALILSTSLWIGCASKMDKASLPATTNPVEELARLEGDYVKAVIAGVDVLAPNEFAKGSEYMDEAREDLKDKEDQSEVIEDLAYATSYLQKATQTAEGRRQHISAALTARSNAIVAGVTKNDDTHKKLKKIDRTIEKASDRLDKDLSADEVARLEREYINLETEAVQANLLGRARSQIQGSIDSGAEKRTPQTLKKAQINLKAAETAVATNTKVPDTYSDAVTKANASAQYLVDVLAAAKKNGKDTSESVAMQLVDQGRKIGNLEGNLEYTQGKVNSLGQKVNEQNKAITLQQALDSARRSFAKTDADVFQQGRNLVIRLKTMNFSSGRSELSEESLAVLTKVSSVVNSLPAQKVTVEGHTDSVGTADLNQKLSAERAQIVAKYLETSVEGGKEIASVGYGYKKPIASNKSKTGRAQNRRVDVVINTNPNMSNNKSDDSSEQL
jgi:OmpA-OmpF porin, OOP family